MTTFLFEEFPKLMFIMRELEIYIEMKKECPELECDVVDQLRHEFYSMDTINQILNN